MTTKRHWYDRKITVIVLAVVFFPVGLYGLWKGNTFSQKWKIGLTISVLILALSTNFNQQPSSTPVTQKKQTHIQSQRQPQPQTNIIDTQRITLQSKPYKVLGYDDTSIAARKRGQAWIYSEKAISPEERYATVVQAAKDIQRRTKAQFLTVALNVSPVIYGTGHSYAITSYSPDGKGISGRKKSPVWETRVSKQKCNPIQIQVLEEWYQNRLNFQKDGMTDEPALINYLSKKLGIPPEDVTFPYIELEDYTAGLVISVN